MQSTPSPGTFNEAGRLVVARPRRRAAGFAGNLLAALAVVLFIPVVILAIGTPIALFLRLLLWVGRLLV